MRVFIGGIMQGSRLDRFIDNQDYRRIIAKAILAHDPEVEIVDPNELHPEGVDYGDELARATLVALAEMAAEADLVVAYVPIASMGTAIEMWQAYRAGVPVVAISPMAANWVIRHLSAVVVPDLDSFRQWLDRGGLDKLDGLS